MELTKAEEKILKESSQAEKIPVGLMILGSIFAVLCAGGIIWTGASAHAGLVDYHLMSYGALMGVYIMAHLLHTHRRSTALVLIRKIQQLRVIESEG